MSGPRFYASSDASARTGRLNRAYEERFRGPFPCICGGSTGQLARKLKELGRTAECRQSLHGNLHGTPELGPAIGTTLSVRGVQGDGGGGRVEGVGRVGHRRPRPVARARPRGGSRTVDDGRRRSTDGIRDGLRFFDQRVHGLRRLYIKR